MIVCALASATRHNVANKSESPNILPSADRVANRRHFALQHSRRLTFDQLSRPVCDLLKRPSRRWDATMLYDDGKQVRALVVERGVMDEV
jgi:hypothetical protein